MSDLVRHDWVALHILPHEAEVRVWLKRHVHRLAETDIDDLMQEAYARLWTSDYLRIANGRSYLYAIIRNLLAEQARRARIVPMERLGEIEALRIPSEAPGPDRRVAARQELDRLERVVARLPEQCRRAFQLQKFEHRSQREIAEEMKISEKTVEKHLSVALERVLHMLKEGVEAIPTASEDNGHESEQSRD